MVIFGYITLLGFIKLILPTNTKNKRFFVFVASIILFLISALRSITFGTDTIGYVNKYISLSYTSLYELLMNVITRTGKDPFFYLFAKVINLTGANYQIWLAILAGIFCYSVSKLVSKYSVEPYISFIALISLGYFYFSLTGLRQTMALSMIILSYRYLRERELVPFIMMILIGTLFHTSAIIFLIAYPSANIKVGLKQILGILIALIIAFFFKESIYSVLDLLNMSDRYAYYIEHGTSLTISGFIIQLAIYLFCLLFKKNILSYDQNNMSLYNLLFLGLVFQAFAIVIAEFFRVSMYFSIFGIVLIPQVIATIKDKYIRVIVYISVLISLVAYIFWTGSFNEFIFFWQG
ncbi:EpsG family protein [Acetoanaerobium noterae]|uniref:EpsG family protein n=1 Tax=Acetoanaerobium noterae TaxID=745369 RepID=UPI0028AA32E4|nr:EpsG family protein [Acetoanaerobium noterae]